MDTNRHEVTCGLEASTSEEMGPGDPIIRFLRLIRFSHTIFALPFALGALVVAANGWPSSRILLLVAACMVFARTAAMLFNRLVDWSLDNQTPALTRVTCSFRSCQRSFCWFSVLPGLC